MNKIALALYYPMSTLHIPVMPVMPVKYLLHYMNIAFFLIIIGITGNAVASTDLTQKPISFSEINKYANFSNAV